MNACCKVSVVIPVYGVEQFVGRCVRSLMEQTLDSVEFIFVDDATLDGSMGEIEKAIAHYPSRASQVRILHHEHNLGLPAARNTGLHEATGEYIFHCDSDDYVEPDMLEKLYETAEEKQADFVWCDWYLTLANSERYMKQPEYATAEEALRSMMAGGIMSGTNWSSVLSIRITTSSFLRVMEWARI